MIVMGSRSSPDSLNGLKFGQKIYFGDVGLGVSGAGGGGGGGGVSSSSSSSAGKKGRTAPQSGQPPRCQVEGCDLDLSDAKAYYSRHKVCSMHSKYTTVIVGGIQQRFCQQCSRFHQLAEFDSEKRSCRRRLAGHNERRRKPPAGSLMSSRMGRMSPSVFDSSSSSSGTGFLVDFTASLKAPEQSAWPGTKVRANHSSEAGKYVHGAWPGGPHPGEMYLHGSVGVGTTTSTTYQVGPSIPTGECFAGVTDSSCALSLLSNQGWSSVNRASPSNLGGQSSSVAHFPWDYKVGEAASHGLQSDLGGLLPHHHPLSSRAPGDELDMAQPGGSYASSTDHMNWLL